MKTLHSSPVTSSNYTCGASTPSTAAQITSPAHVQPDKPKKKKNFFFLKRTQKNKNKNERKSSLSVREAKKTKQQPGRQCYRVFTEFFWLVNRLSSMAYRVLLGFMNTDRVDFDWGGKPIFQVLSRITEFLPSFAGWWTGSLRWLTGFYWVLWTQTALTLIEEENRSSKCNRGLPSFYRVFLVG